VYSTAGPRTVKPSPDAKEAKEAKEVDTRLYET